MGEPIFGRVGSRVERAGFFEEMAGAGDNVEAFFGGNPFKGRPVEFEDGIVIATDNEERGSVYFLQGGFREIRPSSPGDNGVDVFRAFNGGDKGGSRTGAGTEETGFQTLGFSEGMYPMDSFGDALGKKVNIKTMLGGLLIRLVFRGRQEVKKQGGESGMVEDLSHVLVSTAVSAASGAMGKNDNPRSLSGNGQKRRDRPG